MEVMVSKWGNSLGLRLPKAIAAELELVEGCRLALHVYDNRLIGQRVPTAVTLAALLTGITADNLHAPPFEASSHGQEAW